MNARAFSLLGLLAACSSEPVFGGPGAGGSSSTSSAPAATAGSSTSSATGPGGGSVVASSSASGAGGDGGQGGGGQGGDGPGGGSASGGAGPGSSSSSSSSSGTGGAPGCLSRFTADFAGELLPPFLHAEGGGTFASQGGMLRMSTPADGDELDSVALTTVGESPTGFADGCEVTIRVIEVMPGAFAGLALGADGDEVLGLVLLDTAAHFGFSTGTIDTVPASLPATARLRREGDQVCGSFETAFGEVVEVGCRAIPAWIDEAHLRIVLAENGLVDGASAALDDLNL